MERIYRRWGYRRKRFSQKELTQICFDYANNDMIIADVARKLKIPYVQAYSILSVSFFNKRKNSHILSSKSYVKFPEHKRHSIRVSFKEKITQGKDQEVILQELAKEYSCSEKAIFNVL